ncbi:MAG: formylmethanofuran dehydrogenase subunit B, partial [Chromatiales bacterium]
MALADETGGVVDHMHSTGAMRNFLILQEQGWINTTMTEIRNRADFLLFVGTDAVSDFPRFFERAVWTEYSLFGLKPGAREIVYIGRGLDISAGRGPSRREPGLLECNPDRLAEVLSAIRALLAGARLTARTVAGIKLAELQGLVEKMKAARYGVVVWAPGQLKWSNADLIVDGICHLVRDLNHFTRFAGFPLAGNDGGLSAASVCGWQSGYPLRTSFSRGYPEFDPRRFSTQELLKSGTVDVLVWISSFADRPPPVTDVPVIVFAVPHAHFKTRPEVYVPVATPGVDHSGQLVRCDGVVSLPLRQVRDSPLLSVAAALSRLQENL